MRVSYFTLATFYALLTGPPSVFAAFVTECYSGGYADAAPSDCVKRWAMLILKQTGCDGIAWLPPQPVSIQYGNCRVKLGSNTGGKAYDSSAVSSGFIRMTSDCNSPGAWKFSDNSGWGAVYVAQSAKRSSLSAASNVTVESVEKSHDSIQRRASCANDSGRTIF